MNKSTLDSLKYIYNTNGGATVENFIEDFDPVGQSRWMELQAHQVPLVTVNTAGRIILNPAGLEALGRANEDWFVCPNHQSDRCICCGGAGGWYAIIDCKATNLTPHSRSI